MKKVLLLADDTIPAEAIGAYLSRQNYQAIDVLPDANAALIALRAKPGRLNGLPG